MESIERLVSGLRTKEEVLQTVAPDTTERDLAVYEASRIFNQNWRPKLDPSAETLGDFLGISTVQDKELNKKIINRILELEDQNNVFAVVDEICKASNSPEEFVYLMMKLINFAAKSGIEVLE